MNQRDKQGEGHVKKLTRFMTNAPCLAESLRRRCPGDHRHITLVDGRAKSAEVYPDGLCKAICAGFRNQTEQDAKADDIDVGQVREPSKIGKSNRFLAGLVEILELARADEDDEDDAYMEAYDDVNGGDLDPTEVKKARREEMQYIHERKVYEIAKVADALRVTGKMPTPG